MISLTQKIFYEALEKVAISPEGKIVLRYFFQKIFMSAYSKDPLTMAFEVGYNECCLDVKKHIDAIDKQLFYEIMKES